MQVILIPYRKQFKAEPISDLLERIRSSKNIKVSVIRIDKRSTTKPVDDLISIFGSHAGKENLNGIVPNVNFIDMKFTKKGDPILRESAKRNKRTLQELISTMIH